MLKKILIGLGCFVVLLGVAGVAGIYYVGAWNMVFGSPTFETEPPEIPRLQQPAILVYTKTNSFRHVEGIAAGLELIEEIAERRGWSIFHTENSATFNDADLAKFQGVIFHNASGPTLLPEQQQAFQRWLEAGGGWLGTHAAGDSSHTDWDWYIDNLIGAVFIAHIMGPQFQVATVNLEDSEHPVSRGLPATWEHKEEWYSWDKSPRTNGFHIIATIDEDTYTPVADFAGTSTDLRMGDHPILWSNCVGDGRAVYSTMGHAAEAYQAPEHRAIIESAMEWIVDSDAECVKP